MNDVLELSIECRKCKTWCHDKDMGMIHMPIPGGLQMLTFVCLDCIAQGERHEQQQHRQPKRR